MTKPIPIGTLCIIIGGSWPANIGTYCIVVGSEKDYVAFDPVKREPGTCFGYQVELPTDPLYYWIYERSHLHPLYPPKQQDTTRKDKDVPVTA